MTTVRPRVSRRVSQITPIIHRKHKETMRPVMRKSDANIYAKCMDEVRERTFVIRDLVIEMNTEEGLDPHMVELVFVQFRKILELIAFGSLIANREVYEKVRADFQNEWNAKRLLDKLARVNPDYYPVPLMPPTTGANGKKHMEKVSSGFLTKDEFVVLYDLCSTILHAPNPFQTQDALAGINLDVNYWAAQITSLLKFHMIHLVDESIWVVQIPGELAQRVKVDWATPTEPSPAEGSRPEDDNPTTG